MKTSLRRVGNSTGVIIPATFLAESGLQNEVNISLVDHSIIIAPIEEQPRKGWFDEYSVSDDIDAWKELVVLSSEEEEWEW